MSEMKLLFIVSPYRDGLKLWIVLNCCNNKKHRIGQRVLLTKFVASMGEADATALDLVGISLSSLYAPRPLPPQFAHASAPFVVLNQYSNEEPTPFVFHPDGRLCSTVMSVRVHGKVEKVSDGGPWFALCSVELGRGFCYSVLEKRSYFHDSESAARRRLERLFGLPLPPAAAETNSKAEIWVDLVPIVSTGNADPITE